MARDKQKRRRYYPSDGTARDDQIRSFCDISEQESFKILQVSQEIAVSFEKQGNKVSEPGMVNRYHVHKAG